ncbi:MAG: hypothetical protein EA381_18145 [Planctomycetaceae bacterium]|nr:MAG: hypothetical protein EA381_18145 [Planctomycetaceae bacterium]
MIELNIGRPSGAGGFGLWFIAGVGALAHRRGEKSFLSDENEADRLVHWKLRHGQSIIGVDVFFVFRRV